MMEPRDPTIGERVMVMRRRRGFTQQELATRAQMSKTALNRLENGLQSVYAERLATLARLLDVSADYLLGLHDYAHVAPSTTRPRTDAQEQTPPTQRPRQAHGRGCGLGGNTMADDALEDLVRRLTALIVKIDERDTHMVTMLDELREFTREQREFPGTSPHQYPARNADDRSLPGALERPGDLTQGLGRVVTSDKT